MRCGRRRRRSCTPARCGTALQHATWRVAHKSGRLQHSIDPAITHCSTNADSVILPDKIMTVQPNTPLQNVIEEIDSIY